MNQGKDQLSQSKRSQKFIAVIGILTIILGIINIIVSIPFFSLYNSISQGGIFVDNKVTISNVIPDSVAADAGLKMGDIIVTADGQNITNSSQFSELTNANPGTLINVTIERDGVNETFQVTPRLEPSSNKGMIGVTLSGNAIEKRP